MITKVKYDSHDEWLDIRSKYIGGSDAGAVVGMNPYKGAFALWLEKTGKGEKFEGNLSTKTGTYLEDFVAKQFEEVTGKKVRKDNHTILNEAYPFACANVDRRIVGEDALLECKTTNSLPNMRKFAQGEYPETWYCQMTHYMAVTGAKRVYLAVLIACREFKWYVLDRNEDEINALMKAEEEFWKHVVDNTPPYASLSDTEAIKSLYAPEKAVEETIDMTGESDLVKQYIDVKLEIKAAETRKEEIRNKLCARMGNYEYGFTDDYKITWRATSRKTFDVSAFAKDNPSIELSKYYKDSLTRSFDISRRK